MKGQHDQETEGTVELRLWTYAEAVKAVPYLRSVIQSLREHWLALQQARRELQLIDARPGRPDRKAMLMREAIKQEAEAAEGLFDESLRELLAIDVFCLDPAKGLAQIPFRQGDDLAWFVFDLFEPNGLVSWRFQEDPLEARRLLADNQNRSVADSYFSESFSFGTEQSTK